MMLKPKQVTAILPVSERTLRRWRITGKSPKFTKINGRVFYDADALKEWLADQESAQ